MPRHIFQFNRSFATQTNDQSQGHEATEGATQQAKQGSQDEPSQFEAFKTQAIRIGTLGGIGFIAYMVSSGALNLSRTLLSLSPITYLHAGFSVGVACVVGCGALVYRFRASTFLRPERLYHKALHIVESNTDVKNKVGPHALHLSDQVRVYAIQDKTLSTMLKPTRFELAFRVEGAYHDALVCAVGDQSPWSGSQKIRSLAVHVHKDAPETILVTGSLEEAEAVRIKLGGLQQEFHGVHSIKVPVNTLPQPITE